MEWMRRHGEVALLTELALLAVCTFARNRHRRLLATPRKPLIDANIR